MFKGRHFDQSIILLCVRWYLAYGLSLRDLKEMMAERGISIDHSTIHRWVVHFPRSASNGCAVAAFPFRSLLHTHPIACLCYSIGGFRRVAAIGPSGRVPGSTSSIMMASGPLT